MTIGIEWMARTGAALLCLTAALAAAGDRDDERDRHERKICSETATVAQRACANDARGDYWKAVGTCLNLSDGAARAECGATARSDRREADQLCREQLDARRAICGDLGESRYDPAFDPAGFDDPTAPATTNPFYPIGVGDRWEYRSATETNVVEVMPATKLIDGVTCIVVHDHVTEGGRLMEDTNDWFAQAKNGDVHYCGEETATFETFQGDVPPAPELTGIEGSFKAGRDGDKAGIVFLGSPSPGAAYRQEFSLANAEDVARVRSTTYAFGQDADLDQLVPRALAELLCAGTCVVTEELTPLDPGTIERKYYAAGIGLFLETAPDTGEVVRLVGCNVDPRCASLPSP